MKFRASFNHFWLRIKRLWHCLTKLCPPIDAYDGDEPGETKLVVLTCKCEKFWVEV